MEPSAFGGGVLPDADCVGRDTLKLPAVGDDEKQGRREPRGADNQTGKSGERHGSPQPRLGGMADGVPFGLDCGVEDTYRCASKKWISENFDNHACRRCLLDGHKLWEREPKNIPRITEETENRALRLKTLGNAVCPPQVYPILKCIADMETGACMDRCVFNDLQQQ